jgi:hypothetical protein
MMDKKKVFMVLGILAVIGLGYYGYKIYQTTSGSSEKNTRRIKIKRAKVTDTTTEEEI